MQLIYGGKLLADSVVLGSLRVLDRGGAPAMARSSSAVLHCVRRSVLKRAAAQVCCCNARTPLRISAAHPSAGAATCVRCA